MWGAHQRQGRYPVIIHVTVLFLLGLHSDGFAQVPKRPEWKSGWSASDDVRKRPRSWGHGAAAAPRGTSQTHLSPRLSKECAEKRDTCRCWSPAGPASRWCSPAG